MWPKMILLIKISLVNNLSVISVTCPLKLASQVTTYSNERRVVRKSIFWDLIADKYKNSQDRKISDDGSYQS